MHDWVLWILAAASALHVVEEHALGWQGWAVVLGAAGMASVILILVLKKRFRYPDV
jgi:hypothetical protein